MAICHRSMAMLSRKTRRCKQNVGLQMFEHILKYFEMLQFPSNVALNPLDLLPILGISSCYHGRSRYAFILMALYFLQVGGDEHLGFCNKLGTGRTMEASVADHPYRHI